MNKANEPLVGKLFSFIRPLSLLVHSICKTALSFMYVYVVLRSRDCVYTVM